MTIDTAGPNPKLPPYPVTMYPAGRFMLPVPAGRGISSSVFTVNKATIVTAKTAVCKVVSAQAGLFPPRASRRFQMIFCCAIISNGWNVS